MSLFSVHPGQGGGGPQAYPGKTGCNACTSVYRFINTEGDFSTASPPTGVFLERGNKLENLEGTQIDMGQHVQKLHTVSNKGSELNQGPWSSEWSTLPIVQTLILD